MMIGLNSKQFNINQYFVIIISTLTYRYISDIKTVKVTLMDLYEKNN